MATKVQSVMFDKKSWDTDSARNWLYENEYVAPKVDITDRYLRFRQDKPENFRKKSFRTISFGNNTGIKAIIGTPMKKNPFWGDSDESDGSGHRIGAYAMLFEKARREYLAYKDAGLEDSTDAQLAKAEARKYWKLYQDERKSYKTVKERIGEKIKLHDYSSFTKAMNFDKKNPKSNDPREFLISIKESYRGIPFALSPEHAEALYNLLLAQSMYNALSIFDDDYLENGLDKSQTREMYRMFNVPMKFTKNNPMKIERQDWYTEDIWRKIQKEAQDQIRLYGSITQDDIEDIEREYLYDRIIKLLKSKYRSIGGSADFADEAFLMKGQIDKAGAMVLLENDQGDWEIYRVDRWGGEEDTEHDLTLLEFIGEPYHMISWLMNQNKRNNPMKKHKNPLNAIIDGRVIADNLVGLRKKISKKSFAKAVETIVDIIEPVSVEFDIPVVIYEQSGRKNGINYELAIISSYMGFIGLLNMQGVGPLKLVYLNMTGEEIPAYDHEFIELYNEVVEEVNDQIKAESSYPVTYPQIRTLSEVNMDIVEESDELEEMFAQKQIDIDSLVIVSDQDLRKSEYDLFDAPEFDYQIGKFVKRTGKQRMRLSQSEIDALEQEAARQEHNDMYYIMTPRYNPHCHCVGKKKNPHCPTHGKKNPQSKIACKFTEAQKEILEEILPFSYLDQIDLNARKFDYKTLENFKYAVQERIDDIERFQRAGSYFGRKPPSISELRAVEKLEAKIENCLQKHRTANPHCAGLSMRFNPAPKIHEFDEFMDHLDDGNVFVGRYVIYVQDGKTMRLEIGSESPTIVSPEVAFFSDLAGQAELVGKSDIDAFSDSYRDLIRQAGKQKTKTTTKPPKTTTKPPKKTEAELSEDLATNVYALFVDSMDRNDEGLLKEVWSEIEKNQKDNIFATNMKAWISDYLLYSRKQSLKTLKKKSFEKLNSELIGEELEKVFGEEPEIEKVDQKTLVEVIENAYLSLNTAIQDEDQVALDTYVAQIDRNMLQLEELEKDGKGVKTSIASLKKMLKDSGYGTRAGKISTLHTAITKAIKKRMEKQTGEPVKVEPAPAQPQVPPGLDLAALVASADAIAAGLTKGEEGLKTLGNPQMHFAYPMSVRDHNHLYSENALYDFYVPNPSKKNARPSYAGAGVEVVSNGKTTLVDDDIYNWISGLTGYENFATYLQTINQILSLGIAQLNAAYEPLLSRLNKLGDKIRAVLVRYQVKEVPAVEKKVKELLSMGKTLAQIKKESKPKKNPRSRRNTSKRRRFY